MDQPKTKEIEQQYHQLVANGEYSKALHLATQYFDVFPPYAQRVVYYWRLSMACRLKDVQLALATLREAVENGHWFDNLNNEADFHILADQTEFHQLVALCEKRRSEEIANTQPVLKILKPENPSESYPLLFALHGNSSNVNVFAPHWRSAQEHGWLVALPQSPQAFAPETFSWNDWDWEIPTLVEHYSQICQTFPVDRNRVVLAGFSMGAGLALWLALERTIEVRGLICVAPFLSEVEALRSLLAQPENQKLRIYLVASKEDEYCYDVAVKLSEIMSQYGIDHKLDIYTDTGHAFPSSFEQRVPIALDFILNG